MPYHDVIVVGGGLAGMRAAIAAKAAGVDVGLVSKVHPLRSQSSGAHSGINAAIKSSDSWQSHAEDTIKAGAYLADQDIVEAMCQDARQDVILLEHMGVPFSRDQDGMIDVMPFGGSSQPRTCYVGDSAGHIVLQVLYENIVRMGIVTYDEWTATSLMVTDGVCYGVTAYDLASGKLEALSARSTVLATGGIGRIFATSTSAFFATADGVGMAYRAGVPLMDMEMVQYYPTTLKGKGLVVSEAARGEGAYLVNAAGDRFMSSYSSDGDRAPELEAREVCTQAIDTEIREGRGEDDCVFLDFRHLDHDRIDDRLPETRFLVKTYLGLDITKDLVPVQPAAHRPVGGIQVDAQGATGMAGLYAAGEAACSGAHGAGRLGGNSMLDCIVFGRRTGEAAASHSRAAGRAEAPENLLGQQVEQAQGLSARAGSSDSIGSLRRELNQALQASMGVRRDGASLESAVSSVQGLKERYQQIAVPNVGGPYNPSLPTYLELGNMLDAAHVMLTSAVARQESRGAHQRSDKPDRDDANWLQHTVAVGSPEGPQVSTKPVAITQWQPS